MKGTFIIMVGTFIALTLVCVLGYAILPFDRFVDRTVTEQSKSFIDSQNTAMVTYMQDYQSLDTKIAQSSGNTDVVAAYRAQQKSDIDTICQMMNSMQANTVGQNVRTFTSTHGGC